MTIEEKMEKYYIAVKLDLIPILEKLALLSEDFDDYIQKNIDSISDPLNIKHMSYIQYRSAHSLFADSVILYENQRLLSCGILSRSLIECMGNIAWLLENDQDQETQKTRADIFARRIENVEQFTSGEIEYMDRMPLSIAKRLALMGDYWQFQYRYVCIYTHVDTAYMTHHLRDETKGVLNLFMTNDIVAFANILNKLVHIYDLGAPFTQKLDEVKTLLIASLRRHELATNPLPTVIDIFAY
jgi:hypothetical protein